MNKILIKAMVNIVNIILQALRDCYTEFHDDDDFQYVLHEIEWSHAHKKYICRFKEKMEGEKT